jgi:hypothetical protein
LRCQLTIRPKLDPGLLRALKSNAAKPLSSLANTPPTQRQFCLPAFRQKRLLLLLLLWVPGIHLLRVRRLKTLVVSGLCPVHVCRVSVADPDDFAFAEGLHSDRQHLSALASQRRSSSSRAVRIMRAATPCGDDPIIFWSSMRRLRVPRVPKLRLTMVDFVANH